MASNTIGDTGATGITGPTGSTGPTGNKGDIRPPYKYFNIGPTGAVEPTVITKAQLQQRTALVNQYTLVKFQSLLSLIVNYHVETAINNIIQILINNTGQKKHLHFLQVPPGKIMDEIVYTLPTVNYDSVKIQAVPIIVSILQAKFPNSRVINDKALSYVLIDWSVLP